MPNGRHPSAKIEHLAMHVASGGSVASFAKQEKIPRRTAYAWTKDAGFQAKVADYRARIIDKLVGSLAKLGRSAVKGIGVLATTAENESVRLAACRAVLNDLINVGNYQANARQFAEMEARLAALEGAVDADKDKQAS
jgi:hypothetical protein